jgi:hypothetical protein
MAGMVGGTAFRLNWLGSTNCRSVEHVSVTGADRGGIAIANGNVFYTGQTATGRFGVASLDATTVMGQRYDALVSNLRNGVVYTFVDAMGAPLTPPGGIAVALREIDGNTGALTTRQVMLSSPVAMMGAASGSTVGFFSGWDRILVMTNGRAYNIDMPAGAVTDLGSSTLPARSVCNSWAFWGVAEMSAGIAYITYVSDPTTISRRPLPTGPVTPVSQFMSLGNMCGFTIAPAAQRWYFHHARGSQLGGSPTAMETFGYCDASSTIAGPLCPPGATSCGGVCRTLSTDAANCGACNNMCVAGAACVDGMCRGAPMRYMRTTPPLTAPFVDACVAAGRQTLLRSVDDAAAVVQLPFDFRYWGATVRMGSDVSISSNGFMTFSSSTTGTPISGMIPAAATPNGVIAPQWRDLVTRADGVCVTTVGVAPDRRFVVHWSNVGNYSLGSATGSLSFEVALNERDQSIDFIYAGMTGAQMSTVGIENNTGTEAMGACPTMTATSCVIAPNTRVRFVPSP